MQSSSLEHKQKTPKGYIHFGSLSGVFGVQGEAKFFLNNLNTSLFNKWIDVYCQINHKAGTRLQIKLRRGSGKKVLGPIKIDGTLITTVEDVQKYVGIDLLLLEKDLPSLDEEEFYHHQLLGMVVVDLKGELVGTITEITPGTVDVLTIRTTEEYMYIPFLSSRVLEIHTDKVVVSIHSVD
jgi:16S rRNA processing protein RimM